MVLPFVIREDRNFQRQPLSVPYMNRVIGYSGMSQNSPFQSRPLCFWPYNRAEGGDSIQRDVFNVMNRSPQTRCSCPRVQPDMSGLHRRRSRCPYEEVILLQPEGRIVLFLGSEAKPRAPQLVQETRQTTGMRVQWQHVQCPSTSFIYEMKAFSRPEGRVERECHQWSGIAARKV